MPPPGRAVWLVPPSRTLAEPAPKNGTSQNHGYPGPSTGLFQQCPETMPCQMDACPTPQPPPGMGVHSLLGQPGPELGPSVPEKMCCNPSERKTADKMRVAAGHQPQEPQSLSAPPSPALRSGQREAPSSFPFLPSRQRSSAKTKPACVSGHQRPGSPQPGVPEQAHQPGPGP